MKTKRRKWRPPTVHPPEGMSVLVVVGNPGDEYPSEWLAVADVNAAGVWSYETPTVNCKVRAWAYLTPIPQALPWELDKPIYHAPYTRADSLSAADQLEV